MKKNFSNFHHQQIVNFQNSSLPGMMPNTRATIYNEMITTLSQIHKVDISKAHLDDFGKKGEMIK